MLELKGWLAGKRKESFALSSVGQEPGMLWGTRREVGRGSTQVGISLSVPERMNPSSPGARNSTLGQSQLPLLAAIPWAPVDSFEMSWESVLTKKSRACAVSMGVLGMGTDGSPYHPVRKKHDFLEHQDIGKSVQDLGPPLFRLCRFYK